MNPSPFDAILATLFGKPDSALDPQERKERAQRRANASAMATNAAENPGEAHMGIPTAGGSGFGLLDLAKLFMGGAK